MNFFSLLTIDISSSAAIYQTTYFHFLNYSTRAVIKKDSQSVEQYFSVCFTEKQIFWLSTQNRHALKRIIKFYKLRDTDCQIIYSLINWKQILLVLVKVLQMLRQI